MNKRTIYLLIGLVLVAGAIGAFLYFKKDGSPKPQTVKVGYLPIYVDLPLFVAKEKGFFEKRGVSVEMNRFEQSPDIGTALVNNNIDAGASIATSVVLNTESRDSGKLKIFVVDSENKENYLSSFVVLKDSGIRDLKDLKGKKIGGFPGPTATTFGKMVLEKVGINPQTDVTWTEIPSSSHLSALETKTVDALFTYEPIATQAVMEKGAEKLAPGAVERYVIEPWQAGVWVVSDKFQKENPELAKQFILAIYEAIDYIRQHPEESKSALAAYTSIKPEIAKATPNIPFTKLGEIDVMTLQKHADIFTERQVISKKIDVSQLLLSTNYIQGK